MIHTAATTIEGQECVLLIIPPDWSTPVESTILMRSETRESVTGVQERIPDQSAPRIGLRYQATLTDTDLQVLRSLIGGLQGQRIAIPYWPDVQNTIMSGSNEITDWANRTIAGQVNVGYNGDLQSVAVTTGGAAPDRNFRGALLVGRLGKTPFRALTRETGTVEISFEEDANWAARATARASDPGTWQAAWEPNWSNGPEQDQRDLLEYKSIGRGRSSAPEGTDDVRLWSQRARLTLTQSAAASLVAFYAARKGTVEAFALPSAIQPGASTSTGPHTFDATNGRVRFSGRDLRITWITPQLADISVAFEQQVETGDQSQTPASYAFLYQFAYEGSILRLTDWEAPVAAASGTYAPARIEHGRIRQSLKPQNETCEITAYLDDVPIVAPLLRMETERPISVTIYEHDSGTDDSQMLFTGTVTKARARGKQVKVTVSSFGGALKRQVPRFQWSHTCNFNLFSEGCRRRNPVAMDQGQWMYTGTIATQWDETAPRVILSAFTAPAGKPSALVDLAEYFTGGWLEIAWGTPQCQIREIVWSGTHSEAGQPDRLFLAMKRVLRDLPANEHVRFWPGCNGRYATCAAKFNNAASFGGFPHIPAWIEQASMGMPKGGK